MTPRRDIEYKAFTDQLNRAKSRKACKALNTDTEYGWDLAVIPTAYHNQKVLEALLALSPNVESDDTKNYAWIGLQDMDLDNIYEWVDKSPVNYYNNSLKTTDKFGMFDKNTGKWSTKGSTTLTASRVCSKYVNCWDISNAVGNGTVTYDKASRVNNTVATVKCNEGATMSGSATLTCDGGDWTPELPTCTYGDGVKACTKITVASATISPAQPVMTGVKITISCASGYTIKGDSVLTCLDSTSFDKSAPTCEKDPSSNCPTKPIINNGTVIGDAPFADGDKVTIICDKDNTLSTKSDMMQCKEGEWSPSEFPTCTYSSARSVTVALPLLLSMLLLSIGYS